MCGGSSSTSRSCIARSHNRTAAPRAIKRKSSACVRGPPRLASAMSPELCTRLHARLHTSCSSRLSHCAPSQARTRNLGRRCTHSPVLGPMAITISLAHAHCSAGAAGQQARAMQPLNTMLSSPQRRPAALGGALAGPFSSPHAPLSPSRPAPPSPLATSPAGTSSGATAGSRPRLSSRLQGMRVAGQPTSCASPRPSPPNGRHHRRAWSSVCLALGGAAAAPGGEGDALAADCAPPPSSPYSEHGGGLAHISSHGVAASTATATAASAAHLSAADRGRDFGSGDDDDDNDGEAPALGSPYSSGRSRAPSPSPLIPSPRAGAKLRAGSSALSPPPAPSSPWEDGEEEDRAGSPAPAQALASRVSSLVSGVVTRMAGLPASLHEVVALAANYRRRQQQRQQQQSAQGSLAGGLAPPPPPPPQHHHAVDAGAFAPGCVGQELEAIEQVRAGRCGGRSGQHLCCLSGRLIRTSCPECNGKRCLPRALLRSPRAAGDGEAGGAAAGGLPAVARPKPRAGAPAPPSPAPPPHTHGASRGPRPSQPPHLASCHAAQRSAHTPCSSSCSSSSWLPRRARWSS